MQRRPIHDRRRRSQGSPGIDHDHRCRVRRLAGASVAALGRPASARALVGPADLPRHLHQARPGAGQPRRVPHDRSRGRPAARLLGHRGGQSAALARVPRRLRQRRADKVARRQQAEQQTREHRKERTVTSRTTQMTTHTLDVPGATLTYDVRRNDASTEPILLLIGAPMGAAGFGTLSQHFSDRTVVTYDPRGVERSEKTDPTSPVTPDVHADDLHRLIGAIGGGPVDLFATSGGAVNALALVSRHPEDVRTLVAHEPPLASILPDREHALAAARAVHETYQRSGWGAGMAHFIAVSSHQGPFTAEIAGQPAPDPAMFGMPTEDDGSRTDPMLGQHMITSTHYEPDFDALGSASTPIVMAAGEESEGQMTSRGAFAVAERLGAKPAIFPSNHGGFLGGEYGQTGQPDAFAAKLREVLAARA